MDLQWTANIKANRPSSVYLFYSPEAFLLEQTVRWISAKLLSEKAQILNVIRFDLTKMPVQLLLQEAQQMSLNGDRKIIIGYKAPFLTATNSKQKIVHNLNNLLSYVKKPSKMNIVILLLEALKLDQRLKVIQVLKEESEIVFLSSFNEGKLCSWMKKEALQSGCNIEDDAVKELITLIGNNLYALSNELIKLSLFSCPGPITKEAVLQLVVKIPEQDLFKFINTLGANKCAEALQIWSELILTRVEPLHAFSLLRRQFRLMLFSKLLFAKGWSVQKVAQQLKVHSYPIKLARESASLFSCDSLRFVLQHIIEVEDAIKAGNLCKSLAMEYLVFCCFG